ncbi:Ubiquitin carboxyl-terminal hydrolase 33 [Parelaphostrongylus tenuis]|uniref:ubiquitinyl hydrolase 1 n=1 Tax=Parelaphostrongylus tenuis TaxID=148309 RepID=A0AAD5RAJ9_PARTN|nr:Ubiquitin carboxyl-terminal hydrolase 33 [Parelaphostrongylus tenuis]
MSEFRQSIIKLKANIGTVERMVTKQTKLVKHAPTERVKRNELMRYTKKIMCVTSMTPRERKCQVRLQACSVCNLSASENITVVNSSANTQATTESTAHYDARLPSMGRMRCERRNTLDSECPENDVSSNTTTAQGMDRDNISHCTHLDSVGKLTREQLRSAVKLQCSICANGGSKVAARWLCLHEECLKAGRLTALCGSQQGESRHASTHFEAYPSHCILCSLRNGRLCCLKCASEIYTDSNVPPIDPEIRRALTPLKRNHIRSSGTASTEMANKKNSAHCRQVTQTRGRSIGSFAVVNRPLAKDMEDEFDLDFPKGLTGLYNLGNTCYFNASIQVLSNCPPFSDYFRDKEDLRPYANREPLVANTMALLIQQLWSAKREPAVFPKALLARVRDNYPQFRGWIQQDAQELIRCLLELLHSELGQPVYDYEEYSILGRRDLERQNSTSSNGSDQFETADSGWSSDGDITCTSTGSRASASTHSEKTAETFSIPLRWRSIVTDVFDGSIESCVTCLTCKTVSVTTETFQDLSLPIPSAEHLSRIRQCYSGDSEGGDGMGSESSEGYGWLSWLRSLSGFIYDHISFFGGLLFGFLLT